MTRAGQSLPEASLHEQGLIDPGPLMERHGRIVEVHARRDEVAEAVLALLLEPRHRGHAVLEQPDLARHLGIPLLDLVQDVVDAGTHAVRQRFAADDDEVVIEDVLDHFIALFADRSAVVGHRHFVTERRVALGERVGALDALLQLAPAGQLMEACRLLDHRKQRVADSADRGVERPDDQRRLALGDQRLHVVEAVALEPAELVHVAEQQVGHLRIGRPLAGLHVVHGDHGERSRVLPVPVDPEDHVEDVGQEVGVQGQDDVAHHVEVPVQEAREANAVRHGSRDHELGTFVRERVLEVDADERDALLVVATGLNPVLRTPRLGFTEEVVVLHPLRVAGASEGFLGEGGDGEFQALSLGTCGHGSILCFQCGEIPHGLDELGND